MDKPEKSAGETLYDEMQCRVNENPEWFRFWNWERVTDDKKKVYEAGAIALTSPLLKRIKELESSIQSAIDLYKSADDERLHETHESYAEASRCKAEDDMYGWNFHQGMGSGKTAASILFCRVRRFLEKQIGVKSK